MSNFDVGQTIRCVAALDRAGIVDGAEYTIEAIDGDGWVKLIGVERTAGICANFFPADCFTSIVVPVASAVHRPHHYVRFKIEPITFIAENDIPFMPGNVIKYVCRHDAKDGVQDLKKARRYLDMMIAKAEGVEAWGA